MIEIGPLKQKCDLSDLEEEVFYFGGILLVLMHLNNFMVHEIYLL